VTYYIGAGAFSNGAATYILTISGTAAAATYTVSYSANGGSGAPAAQTKTQNVSLTLSGVRPTRSGYNFLGWSTSSAATSASYQPGTAFTVNANTTLYAVWQAATVTITWNANGASIPPVSVVKTPGTALGTLPVPARTNYTFAGWFTAASGGTQITASSVVPTVNTIYYARWISTVTITWNANGGSVSPTSAIKQVGTALGTLPTPTRTGYTFNGWYTASSGGTKISASTAVPTGNATYYAQWAIKYVTVMWNSNGGSVSPTSASKQEGTALGTLPTPTRTGYTFNGWYTASSGGAKISTSTIVPSSSVTYYAQWTAKTVTVTWNANGGSASPTSTVKQVGTTLGTLPTPTRTGYTFNGWYTSSSGGTKISASTAVPTGNVTYYAQWAAQNITVTWNANGGNVSPTSIVKTGGTTFGALPTPTRANYTFAGWFTAVSGGTQITVSSAVPLSSTTYYARWTQISITVTWNPNGGSVSPTSASKQAGTTLGILPTPTRTGYTFDGWYTSSSGGTQISASTVAPSSNIMYYAQWSALIPDDYGDTRETAVSINYIDNGVTASGLNVVPFAANVNNPNNVPLGTPIAGNIGYPPGVRDRYDTKDIDYFAFRVPQTASYTIDVFGSSASTLVEGHLYRSDIIAPQEIVAIHYNNHQGGRITQTLNANVVYYLSVRSYQGSYYGDYQLVLNYTYQRTGVSYLDEFLKVAESQLGTVEYNDRAMTVPGTGNYTIYGEWNAEYGSGTGTANPWCVMFMNWCASHAGVPLDVIPWNQTAKSQNLQDWYVAYSRFSAIGELNASNSVTPFRPKAGDLMLFPAHTAIVVADVVNADGISGTTYTIDGNSGNYNNTGEGYRVQYNARNFTIINGVRSYSKQKPNGFAINFGISYGVVPTQYVDNTRSTLL
jgi:uncharacterized repeat protein (TIGR02543 family)